MAFSIKRLAITSAPSCSPSYTSSTFPVMAGIMPIKSDKRTAVLVNPFFKALLSAALIKFSMAEIVILALTPLLESMYSLALASKLICSIISFAKLGT